MSPELNSERRKIPRVPVFFILERLSPTPGDNGREGQGVVKNITTDGLLLESNMAMKKNDLVQLSFTLPVSEKSLNLEARARWVERAKAWSTAGLEFMDLTPEQHQLIVDYLNKLKSPSE